MATDNKPLTSKDLLKLKLFDGEDIVVVEWVLDVGLEHNLDEGETLFQAGQKNDILYLLLEGRMRVELQVDSVLRIDYLTPGDCVGEMSILEGRCTSAFVVADTKCRLYGIKDANLWTLINRSHVIARNLLKILASRVRKEHDVISKSFKLQRTFERESRVDSLTGLYNRRWLDEALERWTHRNKMMSLMLLDIDHFKRYNDTQGHLAGDSVLNSVANTIVGQLRPSDLAARFGGEEFVALLPDANKDEACDIARRVCNAIREQDVMYNNGKQLPGVTISIGVAELQDGQDKHALLAAADAALYRAKNSGRDRVSE